MRAEALLVTLLLTTTTFLAGCLADPAPVQEAEATVEEERPPVSVLDGTIEPADLTAPAFQLLGTVGTGGPVYGAGEPSIWAHLDGRIFLAYPGCDPGVPFVGAPTDPRCAHGLVYVSEDDGATWTRLNGDDGRLESEGPAANGDADVAVDADGTIYTSNLGGGIQVHRSTDGGATWTYLGNVVPEDHWADRQWMAAASPGHLIMTWMGGASGDQRAVAVNTTFDGGANWTGTTYLGEDIGWLGTVQFSPDGKRAYLPFTQVEEMTSDPVLGMLGPATFSLLVAHTGDGGATWNVTDTGVRIDRTPAGGHWSGVLMAPALDVTGDGTVVVAWSEDVPEPTGTTAAGSIVKAVLGRDGGTNWSTPYDVSARTNAIQPWVTGGAGDRFAVTYYASDLPGDSDYVGRWDVMAAMVDPTADGLQVERTVLDTDVHQGGLCSRGGACLLTGSDRALLDFFESDVTPDGRLVVTYPADPLSGGKFIEIRVAIQNGGSLMLEVENATVEG